MSVKFGPVGYPVFKRTYARELANGQKEEYEDMLDRCLTACNRQLKVGFTPTEIEDFRQRLEAMHGFMAGRFMWQLGTGTVDRIGLLSLQNCAGVLADSPIRPFTWTFSSLMLGAGVGANVQREYVYEWPKVIPGVKVTRKDTKDADFIVPDSREGWVKLLEKTLRAFFETGKSFTYSTICIRPRGTKIKTFGGEASGPEILCEGIEKISSVLRARAGKKCRSIDAMDIFNIIGSIVVAGNVRRSAEILLGDPDDVLFLNAKRWDKGSVPAHRSMSNNSLICNTFSQVPQDAWREQFEHADEVMGLVNLRNARRWGRAGDERFPDKNVVVVNPCAEQFLDNYETCCLAELCLPRIESYDELSIMAKYLYRVCKHSLLLPCHEPETEAIVHANMRMGLSVTGYLQAPETKKLWLPRLYDELREFDADYSRDHNIPQSIKLTTNKPSGCSRADSLIMTDQGMLRLDEIGDVNGSQWQILNGIKTHERDITKFFVNGKVATKKIITEDGNILESSLNHRYQVINNGIQEWKYVSELLPGDRLVTRIGGYSDSIHPPRLKSIAGTKITNQTVIKTPEYMSQDLAWFLGLCYGDGSVHTKGLRISFNRKQPSLIGWLQEFVENTFGITAHVDDDHSLYISSTQLLEWLDLNGLLKTFSYHIEVPKIIRQSPKNIIVGFIDGFWRADGGQHVGVWSVCSVSEVFARQLFVLSRAVGYNVRIRNAGPGGLGARDRWVIMSRESEPCPRQPKALRSRYLEGGYWIDPIERIEDSECETFDIEVDDTHRYLLNNVVSHNTLSKLAGCTEGGNPSEAEYIIQRIRFASTSDMLPALREAGYPMEFQINQDGSLDRSTMVVSFPSSFPGAPTVAQVSAVDQLETVARLQREWSDNAVSVTVTYATDEVESIYKWLEQKYDNSLKVVSFLRKTDRGFVQMPREAITKEQFDEMSAKIKPISLKGATDSSVDQSLECAGGACPLR